MGSMENIESSLRYMYDLGRKYRDFGKSPMILGNRLYYLDSGGAIVEKPLEAISLPSICVSSLEGFAAATQTIPKETCIVIVTGVARVVCIPRPSTTRVPGVIFIDGAAEEVELETKAASTALITAFAGGAVTATGKGGHDFSVEGIPVGLAIERLPSLYKGQDVSAILAIIGNLVSETITTSVDDGFSMSVEVRENLSGSKRKNVEIKKEFILTPTQVTFPEVDGLVGGTFALRLKKADAGIVCSVKCFDVERVRYGIMLDIQRYLQERLEGYMVVI